VDAPAKVADLMDEFGIETFDMTRDNFIRIVIKTLGLCKAANKIIDFDDMIWFPFVYRLNVGKFDIVFVDEAQDLNAAQITMVLSAIKPGGRIIAVGDPAQSIYQFRGADSEAIPNIISKLKAKTLPLSVTYRCPKKVIKIAQEVVPDIECADGAPEGIVEDILVAEFLKKVKPGDFVLSRTNAPLIKYCMALLKAGVPANIQGRDVGANLQYFIKKSKAKTIDKFITYVNEWRELETKRLLSEKKDPASTLDKSECLLNLCEGILTIKELKETIEKLFDDVDDNKKAMMLYDLSLLHYVIGLRHAKSDFSYHTIGSTISIDFTAYSAVRGFPERESGEDFYILNKLAKIGKIKTLEGNPILIDGRISNRTPFGTGKSINKISTMKNPEKDFLFYSSVIFEKLKIFISHINDDINNFFCDSENNFLSEFKSDVEIAEVLSKIGAFNAIESSFKSSKSSEQRKKHFHTWFDSFKTLKFIHHMRDAFYPSIPLEELLQQPLYQSLDLKKSLTLEELLEQFKNLNAHLTIQK
jgi:hypothetical protein